MERIRIAVVSKESLKAYPASWCGTSNTKIDSVLCSEEKADAVRTKKNIWMEHSLI